MFDNGEILDANRVGEVNEGVRVLMSGLDTGTPRSASGGPLGLMRWRRSMPPLPYACERVQFNAPIGTFAITWRRRLPTYVCRDKRTVARWYAAYGLRKTMIAAQSRVSIPHRVRRICRRARCTLAELEVIQCLGGNGYINEYPTGRILRDAKVFLLKSAPATTRSGAC